MQAASVLHYVDSQTRAGRVHVVMSRAGIVDIVLAEQDARPCDALASLRRRFPNTRLVADDGSHGSWAAAVVARLDGDASDFLVPIDLGWSAARECRTTAERPSIAAMHTAKCVASGARQYVS